GAGVGKVLQTTLAGAKGTAAANRLRDKGAKLTAGQTIGRPAAAVENILSIIPFAARPLSRARRASEESIHRIALREAAPPTVESMRGISPVSMDIAEMGQAGVDEIFQGFQRAYGDAWGGISDLAPRTGGRIKLIADRGAKNLSGKDRRKIKRVLDDMNRAGTKSNARELDAIIRNEIVDGKKTKAVDKVLREMRATLRGGLPEGSQTALRRLDKQWPKYLAVESAAATAPAMKKAKVGIPGEFGPDQLATG
ncbi:unnamed protein product, partial [marine sediment metagenome]